jgi:acyl-CoA thioester hydrolase
VPEGDLAAAAAQDGPFPADVRRVELKVRFHELDPNGHVNHGVYLNLFETARIEIMERIGLGLGELRDLGVHLVVVEATVRYRQPALAGDVLTIDSHLVELRRASGRWHQQMTRDGDVIAEADVRSASVDADGRPTRPPPDLVTVLERLQLPPA